MEYWVVIMGARRVWQELAVPQIWKMGNFFLLYGEPVHYFFLQVGGLFLDVGAILLLFSRCGGFFSPYGEPFNEMLSINKIQSI